MNSFDQKSDTAHEIANFSATFSNYHKIFNSIKLIIQPIDDVTFGIQVYTAFQSGSDFAELAAFCGLSHLAYRRI
jgi:hypothetical protein